MFPSIEEGKLKKLSIAATPEARKAFQAERTVVDIRSSDLTESSVIVMTATEADRGLLSRVKAHAFEIPIVLVKDGTGTFPPDLIGQVSQVIDNNPTNLAYNGRQIDAAAQRYATRTRFSRRSSARLRSMWRRGRANLTARDIRAARFSAVIPWGGSFITSSVKTSSARTSATRTCRWEIS